MDATRLIEEAGSWAQHVRQSPGNGTAGEDLYLAGLLDKLIAALKASEERARKAEDEEEELRELVARYQEASGIDVGGDPGGVTPDILSKFVQSEEARANAAEKQCAELAAANLAANKRIVELEQETDGLHDALRTCDESRKELIDGLKTARDTLDLGKRLIQALEHERDAARAELEAERCKGCSNG